MQVRIFAVDQETGAEQYIGAGDLTTTGLDPETDEYRDAAYELRRNGRVWVGGGAAQLFLLMREG